MKEERKQISIYCSFATYFYRFNPYSVLCLVKAVNVFDVFSHQLPHKTINHLVIFPLQPAYKTVAILDEPNTQCCILVMVTDRRRLVRLLAVL